MWKYWLVQAQPQKREKKKFAVTFWTIYGNQIEIPTFFVKSSISNNFRSELVLHTAVHWKSGMEEEQREITFETLLF